ncbi:MAG: Ig-like domain-containing protein, partial [Thermoanaerobaculia bacterium]
NVNVNVLANDTDADNDFLSVSIATQPSHGTVVVNPDRTIKYTPAANYNGPDTFNYRASDGNATATAVVTITVTPVNDAPVAVNDTATVAEDGSVDVAVLANDTDVDGNTLTVTAVTQGTHGTVSINPDKTVKYTAAANYNGSDSFTYTISDGTMTATATVSVTVTPVNDAPAAVNDTATVAEDGTVDVNVLVNDLDPDGDALTVAAVTQGTHGTVSINPDKTVKYVPAANYNGSDSFTYTISDGTVTATATVSITVTPVNDAPVAVNDTATVAEDGSVDVAVLANDTDVDGDALTVSSVTQGTDGAVSINADNTVRYVPAANYGGSDSFTYTVSDGNGGSATATVTITVTSVNDAPVANADSATVAEDGNVNVAVLANDTDLDGDTLTVSSVTQGAHGTVSINPDKTVKYTPAANYNGSDSFTYTVSDGNGGSATASVAVTVSSVNDAPVANADSATVAEDGTVNITVLGNDTDADGDTLSVASVTQGAHGTVSINPDKTVKYTPAANYNGADSFTYTASDGNGGSATATVTINVTSVNDTPIANADSITVAEDGSINAAVLANDTDPEGNTLSVTAVTQGTKGTVSINPDKTVRYVPAANANGSDAFTYTISDGNGGTATASVAVTITPVNDAPVAANDSAVVPAGASVIVSVLSNDTDIDSPSLTVTSVTQGTRGTVAINANGTVTYTASMFVGADSFTYTASDGAGGTATATVNVTLTKPQRVATGIQARYDFNEGSGSTVTDTSGVGTPLNLTISNTANVSWLPGALSINAETILSNASAATKVNNAVKASNEVTLEAWVSPDNLTQTGPARLVSIAKNGTQRNVLFGQSANRWESQLKTTTTTATLLSPANSVGLSLTHVVYVRNSAGQAFIYIDGTQVSTAATTGNLSGWDATYKLAVGNEVSGGKVFLGDLYLVAIYGRALSAAEVQQNFLAGSN